MARQMSRKQQANRVRVKRPHVKQARNSKPAYDRNVLKQEALHYGR